MERNRFRTTPVPSAQAEAQAVPWVARTVETGEMKKRKRKSKASDLPLRRNSVIIASEKQTVNVFFYILKESKTGMEQLERLRAHLDMCDGIILDALRMRNQITEDITEYKRSHDMRIVQPEQEEKKRSFLGSRMKGERHQEEILSVFDAILLSSKKIQTRALFEYNLVLIGFMGAGKTTISNTLKHIFAMDVIEMDQIIAEREGMSISEIFETYGEQYFRDAETNLLIELQNRKNVVISCGGGTPLREANVAEMKKNGKVILLTADPETILERVKDSHDRPVIENNKNIPFITELMEQRRPKYEAAADIIIHTDGKNEYEICEEIIMRALE